ncbi:DUF6515 family protein [Cedecea davisae]|uniref:DUF6515 family protein n=1 Tax=Cedecea davisae TaxID=158484 RepID=UPI00376F25E0
MKKQLYVIAMSALMVVPQLALARPGPWWGHGPGFYRGPHYFYPWPRLTVLPGLATAIIVGGLTYYVVNGIYYQRQGAEYVRVETPSSPGAGISVLDYNGKRYYVRNGSYFQKDINGNYFEVPRPAGL